MPNAKSPRGSKRNRVGNVGVYLHHGSWWIRFREHGKLVRRCVAADREAVLRVAAEINAQLACAAPTLFSFTPIFVAALVAEFLRHHEEVLRSTTATVGRYRAALAHLVHFVDRFAKAPQAHQIRADEFVAYLRTIEVAPNGHAKARRRPLRDKGVRYILETARSLYSFARKRRHLPPYADNPFAELPLDRFRVEDSKPIVLFDETAELAFFRAADAWEFPLPFFLAKTGLRVGEALHLLIEDVDLDGGWVNVCNKTGLGWRVKTGAGRKVPLIKEVVQVVKRVVAGRKTGVLFLRRRYWNAAPPLTADRSALECELALRTKNAGRPLSRIEQSRLAKTIWRDAGAISATVARKTFIRVAKRIGKPASTCVKSWRHGYATLLGEANVDPQIRQLVMGHSQLTRTALGMTVRYSHPSDSTIRRQVEQALRLRPESLAIGSKYLKGVV